LHSVACHLSSPSFSFFSFFFLFLSLLAVAEVGGVVVLCGLEDEGFQFGFI